MHFFRKIPNPVARISSVCKSLSIHTSDPGWEQVSMMPSMEPEEPWLFSWARGCKGPVSGSQTDAAPGHLARAEKALMSAMQKRAFEGLKSGGTWKNLFSR